MYDIRSDLRGTRNIPITIMIKEENLLRTRILNFSLL